MFVFVPAGHDVAHKLAASFSDKCDSAEWGVQQMHAPLKGVASEIDAVSQRVKGMEGVKRMMSLAESKGACCLYVTVSIWSPCDM